METHVDPRARTIGTTPSAVPIREIRVDRLYVSSRSPELVRVPQLTFVMVDGHGDPNKSTEYWEAIQALYGLSHTLKFVAKRHL